MFRERRFYSQVRTLMVVHIAIGALIALLVLGVGALVPELWATLPFFLGLGLAAFVMAFGFFLLLARRIWPVDVGPSGVRTYDSIGRYSEVPWDGMGEVKETLGYLWIPLKVSKAQVTVPTYLEEFDEFAKYVLDHAPAANPLRLHLLRSRYPLYAQSSELSETDISPYQR